MNRIRNDITNDLSEIRQYLHTVGVSIANLSISASRAPPGVVNMKGSFELRPNPELIKAKKLLMDEYLRDQDNKRVQLIEQLLTILKSPGPAHGQPSPNDFTTVRNFAVSDTELGEMIAMLRLKHTNLKD